MCLLEKGMSVGEGMGDVVGQMLNSDLVVGNIIAVDWEGTFDMFRAGAIVADGLAEYKLSDMVMQMPYICKYY